MRTVVFRPLRGTRRRAGWGPRGRTVADPGRTIGSGGVTWPVGETQGAVHPFASLTAVDHDEFRQWIARYEQAWRSPGTRLLAELFTEDAVYLHSPYAEPVQPRAAIERDWKEQRAGPDEVFSVEAEVLAVTDDHPDGPLGIARLLVRYGEPVRQEYRDIWLVWFDADGRARRFEEWPFWPGQPWAANQR